jgi:outer membrane lipoprotein SlyB
VVSPASDVVRRDQEQQAAVEQHLGTLGDGAQAGLLRSAGGHGFIQALAGAVGTVLGGKAGQRRAEHEDGAHADREPGR